MHSTLRHSSS